MPSSLAWLDTTSEEQRLTRELLSMFSQKEGRDEIGIGQIRDSFSDILFPGTSTLHTRPRYFLIIPWCFTTPEVLRVTGETRGRAGRAVERRLIGAMPPGEDGVIGARAGTAVKNLPSAVYWSGLERYGILTSPTDSNHLDDADVTEFDVATEFTARSIGAWHPSLPDPPANFPKAVEGGLEMRRQDSEWLSERILASVPSSLLAHLIASREPIKKSSAFPWETVPIDWGESLRHAYVFSTAIHGAQLVYNLLLAREYEKNPDLESLDEPVAQFEASLAAWSDRIEGENERLTTAWDREGMRSILTRQNPRISDLTFRFTFDWIESTVTRGGDTTWRDPVLQKSVAFRERRKGSQSRLRNPKLLASWMGGSATGQLSFRWATVKRMVNDIVG